MSFLLHQGATVMCTHAGQATPGSASTRVKVASQPVVSMSHTFTVSGCAFTTPDGVPKPCASVQWSTPAMRVKVEGAPALLSTSQGITIGPLGTQGTPMVIVQQTRVRGQ